MKHHIDQVVAHRRQLMQGKVPAKGQHGKRSIRFVAAFLQSASVCKVTSISAHHTTNLAHRRSPESVLQKRLETLAASKVLVVADGFPVVVDKLAVQRVQVACYRHHKSHAGKLP